MLYPRLSDALGHIIRDGTKRVYLRRRDFRRNKAMLRSKVVNREQDIIGIVCSARVRISFS